MPTGVVGVGKYLNVHHKPVEQSLGLHTSLLPRADAPPPHNLDGVVLPPRETEALNSHPAAWPVPTLQAGTADARESWKPSNHSHAFRSESIVMR